MSATNSPARYDAWLIDLDGTLYRALPLRLLMAAELALVGWRAVGILRRFRAEHERVRHSTEPATTTPYELQIERTAQALQLPASRVEVVVQEWMQERPQKWLPRCLRRGLIGQIGGFRQAGGRVAVVSDYPASSKLSALGVSSLIEAVVSSGETPELKRLKPAPDGYLLAAEMLGVPAENCLVIGDRDDTDGEAACAAKMDFLHIRQIGRLAAIRPGTGRVEVDRPATALGPVSAERPL